MNKNIFLIFLISFLLSTSIDVLGQANQAGAANSQWKLVWHDEFNYNGLPDSSKWSYEEGYYARFHQQFYTKNRLANTQVHNGNLIITARKEVYRNPEYKSGMSRLLPKVYSHMERDSVPANIKLKYDSLAYYTSGAITTRNKVSWLHGRIEIRAKLPSGKGISCAIWMLRVDNGSDTGQVPWPGSGEIDICESVGKRPDTISSTVHYANIQNQHLQDAKLLMVPDISSQFHIYSVEWDTRMINFFCDGQLYHSFPINKSAPVFPFVKPFYLIFSVDLGVKNWTGPIDDSNLPQQLLIDYVRVYQK